MSFLLTRTRLLEVLQGAAPIATVIAPAGWGKSALLESAASSDLRLVTVALGSTEGHPSLLVEAFAQGLKRAYPGTAVGAVRAVAGLRGEEAPAAVLERTRAALGVASLTVAFDELERLPRGPVFEVLRRLVAERPAALRLVFTSRLPLPPELGVPAGPATIDVAALAMTGPEIERATDHGGALDRALARAIARETGGWPALVSARLRASRAASARFEELAPALSPVIDEAIGHIRSEARYVLQVSAVLGSGFDRALVQSLVTGEVSGSAEARRRLMRLEPAVVQRALDELVRSSLVLADGDKLGTLVGLQGVLRERFRAQDRGGWMEAHRRAAELRMAAGEGRGEAIGPELVDLFASSGERERLLDVVGKHGSRLELALADEGEDERLLRWVEAIDQGASGPSPSWNDVIAGLAHARRGEGERAKERLDKAREKLAAEKREPSQWRWQARLAEAQGLVARMRHDATEARSWLMRGLDQIVQTKKRGLGSKAEEHEATQLELRLSLSLARLGRESTSWDKTREAASQALALLGTRSGDDARAGELRRILVAGAFSAGDHAVLEVEQRSDDDLGKVAAVALGLLRDGAIEPAVERLRALDQEPLAWLFLARILEPGRERERCLEQAAHASDPWVALEAEQRSARAGAGAPGGSEGYSGAAVLEAQAAGPGRALEIARDAYRRVGARWDEARLWLALGAAASRRVDDGDGEADAIVRPVDGVVEAAVSVGFAVPWGFAGRGEADPERRVRTLLLAGLRGGQERSKAICRQELERLGIDTRAVAAANQHGKAGAPPTKRATSAGASPFVQISRVGSQGVSAQDYQAIVNSKSATAFIVCVPDQLVLNFGRQVSLGQKRVMMPLLLHLLRNPDDSFSMLELAREVWSSPELTPTVQTKVKVAVSRLRALLGKSRNYIITTRKMEDGESVVAYQTAPQLQYLIIEPAPRD